MGIAAKTAARAVDGIPTPVLVYGAAALLALGGLWWLSKGGAKAIGTAIGTAAVDVPLGVVGGINDALGIPRTSDVINWYNRTFGDAPPVQ